MINVFNSPIEASTIDEFTEEPPQEAVFEKRKRRPKSRIHIGWKKDEQTPDTLWTTTISRGVANDWKEKATGGPLHKLKHYTSVVCYDVKTFVHRSLRNYGTPILLIINFCLGLTIFRLFNIF
ncbi:hypothetical protein KIN20_027453 [Parelaphostrongylus tenuis]|uniref:Uncharacterized protein n=1 Tax=Parelaphostrongylus tenuis TaxID=148309 RepID=A0AAD5QZC1_PARTN|nr:hypothetical protein KIN20_027453 [Parelaphostrongylus tenuis]